MALEAIPRDSPAYIFPNSLDYSELLSCLRGMLSNRFCSLWCCTAPGLLD
jgi:hypothetical protein